MAANQKPPAAGGGARAGGGSAGGPIKPQNMDQNDSAQELYWAVRRGRTEGFLRGWCWALLTVTVTVLLLTQSLPLKQKCGGHVDVSRQW